MKQGKWLIVGALAANIAWANVPVIDGSQRYAEAVNNQPLEDNGLAQTKRYEDDSPFINEANAASEDERFSESQGKRVSSSTEHLQLLFNKLEQMQQEIASLRGQLELQAHQIKLLSKGRLPDSSLHKRNKLSESTQTTLPAVTIAKPKSEETSPQAVAVKRAGDPMDEQLSYVAAYELVKNKQYEQAREAMSAFLDRYPAGPYAANAHYWLGELYILAHQYTKALASFKTIVDEFADSNKFAAATYKLGVVYEQLGHNDKAHEQFIKVTEAFPGTTIARLAKAKLAQS